MLCGNIIAAISLVIVYNAYMEMYYNMNEVQRNYYVSINSRKAYVANINIPHLCWWYVSHFKCDSKYEQI